MSVKIIVSQYFWDSIHHVIRPVGRGEVEGMNEPKNIVSQYFVEQHHPIARVWMAVNHHVDRVVPFVRLPKNSEKLKPTNP